MRPEGHSPGAKNKEITRKPLSGAKGWAVKSLHYKHYGFMDPLLHCCILSKCVFGMAGPNGLPLGQKKGTIECFIS